MVRHPRMTDAAYEYFSRFARFEYALRKTDFLLIDENEVISADWDRFASTPDVRQLFRALKRDENARYLIEEPPMKRIAIDRQLDWRDVARARSANEMCASLRRLRNNLFHGDKAHPFSERDERLLNAGSYIIEALLEVNEAVRRAYERDVEMA